MPVLPSGHISVNYRGGRDFFQSGVWFHLNGGRYRVVRPPLGLIVPVLPAGSTTVWVGSLPYYYANEVYYTSAPNGYAVAAPPEDANWQAQAPQQSSKCNRNIAPTPRAIPRNRRRAFGIIAIRHGLTIRTSRLVARAGARFRLRRRLRSSEAATTAELMP